MKNLYHDIERYTEDGNLNVVIEVGKGMMTKYEFDKDLNAVVLDRILTTPIPFPYNYGFIPQTWNTDDKDPLDAIVISSQPLVPGCLVTTRVIGYMAVEDRGEKDDKVLCVPVDDPVTNHMSSHDDMSQQLKGRYEYFMNHYKDLEKKKVEFKSWHTAEDAKELIDRCYEDYKAKE